MKKILKTRFKVAYLNQTRAVLIRPEGLCEWLILFKRGWKHHTDFFGHHYVIKYYGGCWKDD